MAATIKFHFESNVWYWCESETYGWLVRYDLHLTERGSWSCTCPYYAFHSTCKHSDRLYEKLNGPTLITPARLAVKRAQAQGISLVSLMDYTAPPAVTNRRRVQAPRLFQCARCGHENEPGAVSCEVCGAYPVEASLKQCS